VPHVASRERCAALHVASRELRGALHVARGDRRAALGAGSCRAFLRMVLGWLALEWLALERLAGPEHQHLTSLAR